MIEEGASVIPLPEKTIPWEFPSSVVWPIETIAIEQISSCGSFDWDRWWGRI